MRLIDATEAAEVLAKEMRIDFVNLVDTFAAVPTVDAVPVVRCKDCEHAWRTADGLWRCEKWGTWTCNPCVDENDFCSYGGRKDCDAK